MFSQLRENFLGEFRMRKTVITATLAFVLGGGAVFFYLNHNAKSNTYATMPRLLRLGYKAICITK